MRQTTAIVLVVSLAFAGVDAARAAQADDEPAFRNPIEWLLNDIGKLFSGVVLKKQYTAAEKSRQSDSASEPETAAPVPDPAPTASAAAGEDTSAPDDGPSEDFRNPLTWLFSDLARIFQPDLEIERTETPDAITVARATSPGQAKSETAAPATPEIAAETTLDPDPEPAVTVTADTHPKNPIRWLFSDLARLFAPENNVAGVVAAESPVPATPEVATVDPTPVVPADPVAETSVEKNDASPLVTQLSTAPPKIEIGPWVPRPADDPFDPNNSLFTTDARPLLSATAPVLASEPAPVVKTADAAERAQTMAAPEIRERPPDRPLRRNHAALGQEHKAVTPDTQDESIIDRVLENLFGIDEPVAAEETLANKVSDRIVPEEKLDLGYTAPDAQVPAQELTRLENGPLANIDLYMGRDSVIGAPYDKTAFNKDACVERAVHGSVFCLKALNWPAVIASSFNADTAFILPGEGVVRFENGAVSRVYSVFKASDFTEVVKYMQHRFGPPQEREVGWMHMLEAPQMPNTTFRWKAVSPDRRYTIILEVRNFDDLRRSFADMEHGMVRLYRQGSRPIFKHISTMDLMLIQRRRVANAPVEVNAPPKQH